MKGIDTHKERERERGRKQSVRVFEAGNRQSISVGGGQESRTTQAAKEQTVNRGSHDRTERAQRFSNECFDDDCEFVCCCNGHSLVEGHCEDRDGNAMLLFKVAIR